MRRAQLKREREENQRKEGKQNAKQKKRNGEHIHQLVDPIFHKLAG